MRIGKHDADKKKLYVMADDWPRINAVDESLNALVSAPPWRIEANDVRFQRRRRGPYRHRQSGPRKSAWSIKRKPGV